MKEDHARRVLDFQQVRRVPLAAILERYNILASLKRIGRQHFGCCPIHGGSNRKQFVVSLDNDRGGLWRCFSPDHDSGGDALSFVAEMEKVDVQAAAQLVAQWFAIGQSSKSKNHIQQRSRKMSEGSRPTHKVYSAQKRGEGEKDWLTLIGKGWPFEFKDKKSGATRTGMNIQLSAMPLGERIVIFEADAEEEEDRKENGKSFKKK